MPLRPSKPLLRGCTSVFGLATTASASRVLGRCPSSETASPPTADSGGGAVTRTTPSKRRLQRPFFLPHPPRELPGACFVLAAKVSVNGLVLSPLRRLQSFRADTYTSFSVGSSLTAARHVRQAARAPSTNIVACSPQCHKIRNTRGCHTYNEAF